MIRFPHLRSSALALAVSLTATVAAFADGPKKTSPDLARPATSVVSIIIQFNSAPTAAEMQLLNSIGATSAPVMLNSIHAVQISLPWAMQCNGLPAL